MYSCWFTICSADLGVTLVCCCQKSVSFESCLYPSILTNTLYPSVTLFSLFHSLSLPACTCAGQSRCVSVFAHWSGSVNLAEGSGGLQLLSYYKRNQLCLIVWNKSSIQAWVPSGIMAVIIRYWWIPIYFPNLQGGQRSDIKRHNWASISYRLFPYSDKYPQFKRQGILKRVIKKNPQDLPDLVAMSICLNRFMQLCYI